MKRDRLAFDRGTVRRYDADGRLHVEIANISKAMVNPYYGYEIPGSEELGLDAQSSYYMLRPADELEKAAPTFSNLPLMSQHVPTSAEDPQADLVVGCVGSDVVFEAPYLKASLCVWDSVAIAAIEGGQQREISCGYHYDPDMAPGEFEGQKFDGIMRNIVGNHVALVEVGRAGPDVVVGDSQFPELSAMKMSRKAIALRGALKAYLRPKIAQDGAIHLNDIVQQVKAKVALDKAGIMKAVEARFANKLAKDANLADLGVLIDTFAGDDAEEVEEEMEYDAGQADPGKSLIDPEGTNKKGVAEDGVQAILDFLKGKLSEEDHASVCKMMGGGGQDSEEPNPPKTEKTPPPPSKGAMDAAINLAVEKARRDTVTQMNAIREAERAVLPIIGEVAAMDSAEAVYKLALDHVGVDLKGVEPSAYRHLVRMLPRETPKPMGADAANDMAAFQAMFPNAKLPLKGV